MAKRKGSAPVAIEDMTEAQLQRELHRAELQLALTETRYTAGLMGQLDKKGRELAEAQLIYAEPDEANWEGIGAGTAASKLLGEARDSGTVRRQMYRLWRFHPIARGILRNFVRFVMGSGFTLDYDDPQRGKWNDDKTQIATSENEDDAPLPDLIWEEFDRRNNFKQRAKEIVMRTFRDGECFVRKFERNGHVALRFIEPERVGSGMPTVMSGTMKPDDLDDEDAAAIPEEDRETRIKYGIEFLKTDIETVVAYHVQVGLAGDPTAPGFQTERIPAKDVIHIKCLADSNDLRGIPMLEVVAKRLKNFDDWEEYRLILNKIRTAIALVRKVEGTSTQAAAIIAARQSPRAEPRRLEPQTTSGRREAMYRPGTTLTPGPGVTYDFISPNLQARDASEDGRRFLMTIASGVGLPEMLVTSDWSNSNFASSVEARTPAVREWEDWQEFFTPVFQRIYRWVITAAIEGLHAPKDTSLDVTLQWPPLIAKDAFRETERLMNLWASGIISKQTWSAMEDLNYDDEQENLHDEATEQVDNPLATDVQAAETAAQQNAAFVTPKAKGPMVGGKAGPPPSIQSGQNPYIAKLPSRPGGVVPPKARIKQEALSEYRTALLELQEGIDGIDDPDVKAALERYMASAHSVFVTPSGRRHVARAPHRRSRSRSRR